ncbi:nucleotide pyrophosphohydrolase [bacterium]|nr:nucleotide pyrophosphohydrolase [bacterium]
MIEGLIEEIKKFRDVRDWKQFHTPENLAKSINIEAGELLECFQWNSDYKKDEVKQELADVLIYCLFMLDAVDLDFYDIVSEKMKLNGEKYSVEKAKGNSKKSNKL